MRYRVSFRSNPRLFILGAVLVVLAAAAIGILVAAGALAGIIAILIAGYLIYQLVKFLRLQLESFLEISDAGVQCRTSIGEKLEYEWGQITHSGILVEPSGKEWVYLYDEHEDRLLTIPDNFENQSGLVQELAGHVSLERESLGLGESVQDRLKKKVGPRQTVVEDEEPEPSTDEDNNDDDDSENE